KALGRRWWVLAIVGLVGAGIAFAITPTPSHRQPQAAFVGQLFRGTHTIQLTGTASARASSTMTNAQLLLQTDVQQRLAASLGAQALQGVALSSTADNGVGTLAVTAVANDGARA